MRRCPPPVASVAPDHQVRAATVRDAVGPTPSTVLYDLFLQPREHVRVVRDQVEVHRGHIALWR